jgi:hypothetical protein
MSSFGGYLRINKIIILVLEGEGEGGGGLEGLSGRLLKVCQQIIYVQTHHRDWTARGVPLLQEHSASPLRSLHPAAQTPAHKKVQPSAGLHRPLGFSQAGRQRAGYALRRQQLLFVQWNED